MTKLSIVPVTDAGEPIARGKTSIAEGFTAQELREKILHAAKRAGAKVARVETYQGKDLVNVYDTAAKLIGTPGKKPAAKSAKTRGDGVIARLQEALLNAPEGGLTVEQLTAKIAKQTGRDAENVVKTVRTQLSRLPKTVKGFRIDKTREEGSRVVSYRARQVGRVSQTVA
jgi:hypothetical protein